MRKLIIRFVEEQLFSVHTRILVATITLTIGLAVPLGSKSRALPTRNPVVERVDIIVGEPRVDRFLNSTMANSPGLVVLSSHYKNTDFIQFYSEDGSPWYRFTFYYDDRDGKFDYENPDFRPLAFHVDYFLLALKCVKREADRFEVVVNEETNLHKYVKTDDHSLRFETWVAHLLRVGAIGFDQETNPPRTKPNGQDIEVAVNEGPFIPVEVRGQWLKVRWASSKTANKRFHRVGWIRWKKQQTLLVEFLYLC